MNFSLSYPLGYSLGLALGLLPLTLVAQTPAPAAGGATVSGTAVDGRSQEPLSFATVLLRRAGAGADTALVASGQTSAAGAFGLEKVPAGSYRLRVLALGYQNLSQAVQVAPGQTAVALGTLRALPAAQQLGEVQVTGQKATVQNELGKRVINVEKDLASVGGVATDVLRNVPSVAVDANGAVSLRGSSNLTILIDGKPAGTSNGGPGGVRLDQIPASRIAQIEVMTNPSAKYDAQGTGVINLILKKNTKPGVNGQAGLMGGTRDKYGANFNLSRQAGKATLNVGYDFIDHTYRNRTDNRQTARPSEGATDLVETAQTGDGTERNINHSLRVGLDYELNKEQSLSLNVSPTWQREKDYATQLLTSQPAGQPATAQRGEQRFDVDVKVLENSLSYRRTWAQHEGRELTAVGGAVLVDAAAPVTQALSDGPLPGWRQQLDVKFNVAFAQLDYVHPLPNKARLETGFKVQRQGSDGTADLSTLSPEHPTEYVRDPARSLAYNFQELVPAAYATYGQSWGNWQAQGGLRAEHTRTRGAVEGGQGAIALDYLGLFPTLTVSRGLGRPDSASGGERPQKLQFSYARRLNRPNFMQQLAVPLYQDPRFYRLGNPALRAEFSHNLELGHQLNLAGGASFSTTLFARFTPGSIQRLRSVDTAATRLNPGAGLVLAETYRNFGTTANLGLELTAAQPLARWWRVQATASFYRAQLQTNAPGESARRLWAGDVRLNQNFQPTKTLDVQLTGVFHSATLTAQGEQLARGGVDVALRQRLFDNRAALTLRVSDVFNTQVYRSVVDAPDLTASYYNKPETRVGWLGFTWFVGASKAKAGRIESAPQGGGGFGK